MPIDVRELGCDFYAASGQKWLCGPGGMGYLYANPELVPSLPAPWAGYHSLEDAERGLDPALWPDARRLGTGFPAPHHVEWAHASLDVLEAAGFDRVHERGIAQADRLAELLRERGVTVAPRGATTLVSFEVPDPPAFAEQAAAEGLVIRGIPGPRACARLGGRVEQRRGDRAARGARRLRPLVVDQRQDAEHDRRDHHGEPDDSHDGEEPRPPPAGRSCRARAPACAPRIARP